MQKEKKQKKQKKTKKNKKNQFFILGAINIFKGIMLCY